MSQELMLWNGLVGFFLPLLIAVVVKMTWPGSVKAITAFVISLIAAAGTTYFQGQFDPTNLTLSFLIIFSLAVTIYKMFWKELGIAPAIEQNVLP